MSLNEDLALQAFEQGSQPSFDPSSLLAGSSDLVGNLSSLMQGSSGMTQALSNLVAPIISNFGSSATLGTIVVPITVGVVAIVAISIVGIVAIVYFATNQQNQEQKLPPFYYIQDNQLRTALSIARGG